MSANPEMKGCNDGTREIMKKNARFSVKKSDAFLTERTSNLNENAKTCSFEQRNSNGYGVIMDHA